MRSPGGSTAGAMCRRRGSRAINSIGPKAGLRTWRRVSRSLSKAMRCPSRHAVRHEFQSEPQSQGRDTALGIGRVRQQLVRGRKPRVSRRRHVAGNWLAGLALGISEGDGEYELLDGTAVGEVQSTLTSVYPCCRGCLGVDERVGHVRVRLRRAHPQARRWHTETDISMGLRAGGARGCQRGHTVLIHERRDHESAP